MFGAFVYPSREGLPEYLAYRQEVESVIERINRRWAHPDLEAGAARQSGRLSPARWPPSRRYDVLLVNPLRDGMNLVAKEGPLVNARDGVLVLSPRGRRLGRAGRGRCGACTPTTSPAPVTPSTGAGMAPAERAPEAAELRRRAEARTPREWLADQLAAAR